MQRFGLTLLAIILIFFSSQEVEAVVLRENQSERLREFMFQLINESRDSEGLSQLTYSTNIERVAQGHANDTAEHFDLTNLQTREETYLKHVSSDGRSLSARYRDAEAETGWEFAENVGYWIREPFGETLEASEFGLSLMNQGMVAEVPPNDQHRRTIMGNYTHAGIGLALAREEGEEVNAIFFVSNFSRYSNEKEERAYRERLSIVATSPRSILNSAKTKHGGPFPDVRPDDPFASSIAVMKERKIIQGYPDGSFQPERTVNRAEFLKMMLDTIGFSPIGLEFYACFSDVFNQWFAPYVCVAKRNQWVEGYSDGSFRPESTVNRAEAVVIAQRILQLSDGNERSAFTDIPEDSWFSSAVFALAQNDLLPFTGRLFSPASGMQRAEVAGLLDRFLQNQEEKREEDYERTGVKRSLSP